MKQLEAASKEEIEATKAELRNLPFGTKIKCILRHVSKSGMLRIIDMQYVKDNELHTIWIRDPKGFFGVVNDQMRGYKVGGCGMDMGFHLVYSLGCYIWNGHIEQLKKQVLEATPKADLKYIHESLIGESNPNGGYYFKQEWL